MGSQPRFESIDLPVLQKFKLYSTPSYFYLIGSDETKIFWRILKIGRMDKNELNLFEDPTKYTKEEIRKLKRRIFIGNEKFGGLREITTCYGIIGFIRFLEPYYMLVITKRKKVGEICGHTVYGIAESKMIVIPYPSVRTEVAKSEAEKRYMKLLNIVDLSKNFYFSYTYHLMYSLQKNICNTRRDLSHDNTLFVWNSFLTRGIRGILQNTVWTVALVYGFFEQTICSVSGEYFVYTIIARRSRHYAGTRYLRRGLNDNGRVANDVETEQIVSKVVPEDQKISIASVVQIRGSIPLFWSQEGSIFIPKPEIILDKKRDPEFSATQLHFENLRHRYGERIIIMNLLKSYKPGHKKNRETGLRAEFAKTIRFINKGMDKDKENLLEAIHYDLHKHYKRGVDGAFEDLCKFARKSLESTNLFHCKAPSGVGAEGVIYYSFFNNPLPSQDEEESVPDIFMRQNGVLRTNCIDCLDRTNFAQYAHGLVALDHQLRTLGISGPPVVDLNNPLAIELMDTYQKMGNTIAQQYGGSEAHSKMFCDLRDKWSIVTNKRDLFIAVVRYYNNAILDSDKQNAINLFLGYFRPRLGLPTLWELDSEQNDIVKSGSILDLQHVSPLIRRSLSGNNLIDGALNLEELVRENSQPSHEGLNEGISETFLDDPICESEPDSLSFRWDRRNEELLNETGSEMIFQGSSSNSDSERPEEVQGFAHSYQTKFTPAEEIFDRCSSSPCSSSSNSLDYLFSDHDESVTSLANTDSSFDIPVGDDADLIPGFSNDFTRWVFSGNIWQRVYQRKVRFA